MPNSRARSSASSDGHVGLREAVLQPVLHVGQRGEKLQIGRERMAFRERAQARRTRRKHRQWIGKTDEGRLGDLPDRDRIMPRGADATHNSRTLRVTWLLASGARFLQAPPPIAR